MLFSGRPLVLSPREVPLLRRILRNVHPPGFFRGAVLCPRHRTVCKEETDVWYGWDNWLRPRSRAGATAVPMGCRSRRRATRRRPNIWV